MKNKFLIVFAVLSLLLIFGAKKADAYGPRKEIIWEFIGWGDFEGDCQKLAKRKGYKFYYEENKVVAYKCYGGY